MPIVFHEREITAPIKNAAKLKKFIREYIKQQRLASTVDVDYIFCNDDFLLQLNKRFLDHDTLTDILTFDMSEQPKAVLAEIYISVEMVKRNAQSFQQELTDELLRVIFHGMLHLCGAKDKTPAQKKAMHKLEDDCLAAYKNYLAP